MADVPGCAFSNYARMNVQMDLEAVQHSSGVPRYGISLLAMFQMWLMFVLRVCTVPRNRRTVTCHTLHRRLPNNNFGSLRKRSEPFSLHWSGGWKNQGQNKGKRNKRSKNKIQRDCNFIRDLQSPSAIQHLLVPLSLQCEVVRVPTLFRRDSNKGQKMYKSLYIGIINSKFFLLDSDQLG